MTEKSQKPKIGRPTKYSKAEAERICDWIAGGKSLRSYCDKPKNPARQNVVKWLKKYDDFRDQYARAREEQQDYYVDEMVDIADNCSEPLLVDGEPLIIDKKPVMVVTQASIAHAKLMIDTRKWTAMKLKPKKYGAQAEQEISNNDDTGVLELPATADPDDWAKGGIKAMERIKEAHGE